MIHIRQLALRRLKYNKSRSILTALALILMSALLTAIGSAAIGLVDFQQKTIAFDVGNAHATLKGLTYQQSLRLQQHEALESLVLKESFADIVQDNLNAALNFNNVQIEGIQQTALVEGRMPEAENEIAGPPSLFERLGVTPEIGSTVTISFRVQGEGQIQTKDFIITGLQEQVDLSVLNISDARIAFGAVISETLIHNYLDNSQRIFNAQIRVDERLTYGEIETLINEIAADTGLNALDVSFNSVYLMWMTDPGTGTIMAMAGLGLLVILLGGMVIYNIYYVSVISNIQELGKLKALGATKKQIKQMLLTEGMLLAGVAIPAGLILGYLCSYTLFSVMSNNIGHDIGKIRILSLPVIVVVAAAILLTIRIALATPVKIAAKISPVEAISYQEQNPQKQSIRSGYQRLTLIRLSFANLTRNKKRTFATILTMGLTCVLFLAVATVLNNINTEDYARQTLTKGEFKLSLNYSLNDTAYLENNLDFIQKENPLSPELINLILSFDGVTKIDAKKAAAVIVDYPSYPYEKVSIGTFSAEDVPALQSQLKRGKINYGEMLEQKGIIFTWDAFFDEYGFEIGDEIPLIIEYEEYYIQLNTVLMASTTTSQNEFWIPEDLLTSLLPGINLNESLYIYVDNTNYDEIKIKLQEIDTKHLAFSLMALDEETLIAELALKSLKYPIYGLLLIVGIISFMSLINTMITSILTRKRELGILQAIGLSNKQLLHMLQWEGLIIITGALVCGLVIGNFTGWCIVKIASATNIITVSAYRYPLTETFVLVAAAILGQFCVTMFISKYIHKESLVTRIASSN